MFPFLIPSQLQRHEYVMPTSLVTTHVGRNIADCQVIGVVERHLAMH